MSSLRAEVEAYLSACEDEGHSPRTLETYRGALRIFLPWAEEQGLVGVEDLDDKAVALYRAFLVAKPNERKPGEKLSRHSVHGYMRPVRQLANHYRLGVAVKLPRLGRKVKTVVSREEQQKLEDACRNDRDRLMLWLMGRRAVRVTEVTLIREGDLFEIGRSKRFVRIHGKGSGGQGEERAVPVPASVYRQLQRLAEQARGSSGMVFESMVKPYGALTANGIQQVVEAVARSARVIKDGHPVSPHDLRHSVITYWFIERQYGEGRIKEIAGNHSALDGYIHLRQSPDKLAEMDWD